MIQPDIALGQRFLEARPPPGRLLLCGVTGSHFYGFPSADSNLDLKGIHLVPTPDLLGLAPLRETHDRLEVFEGLECDLTTHEARMGLSLLLRGNGNMLERLLSPFQLVTGPEVEALARLGSGAISKKFFKHYAGFFHGMCREHERQKTSKTMLYCLRVALTGIHLLKTGALEGNVGVLGPQYGVPEVAELIAFKREGTEKGALAAELDTHFRGTWPQLEAGLKQALDESPLPEAPGNAAACHRWLVEMRLADVSARASTGSA